MNLNEVRQLLGMPKYEFSEREVIAALVEYNKKSWKGSRTCKDVWVL